MSIEAAQPSSWRDVYTLVRDTHEDAMSALRIVDAKVTDLGVRVGVIEQGRRDEKTARDTEATLAAKRDRRLLAIVTASRGTIALLISIAAVVLAAAK